MKYTFLFILLVGSSLSLSAQETFTDYLQKRIPGKGTVVLHQDITIQNRVNGFMKKQPNTGGATEKNNSSKATERNDATADTNGNTAPSNAKRKFTKVQGYRIQIYAGGNSRTARREAERAASECQAQFPEMAVYTHFLPPRWVCRVGDFRSYEEANACMLQMREKNLFREATIVKSMVVISL